MNCAELKRWLDRGKPPSSESAAEEHAVRCEPCSALLRAERSIETLLSRPQAALGNRSRFVDQVMERVQAEERPVPRAVVWPGSTLPWWIQAATDPAAVLACVLAALLAWKVDWLLVLARFAGERWSLFTVRTLEPARAAMGLDRPGVALGLELLFVMALGWFSFQLYRWTERLARRTAGR